jgi:Na+:H+ antiporter, NhaA family
MATRASQSKLVRFINHEATAGLLLVLAAALALVLTNVGLEPAYNDFQNAPVTFGVGELTLRKTLLHFINDGLMAIFFFVVGLEIKREVLEGNLSSRDQVILPAAAAAGGMAIPAAIYLAFNAGSPSAMGWAIPAATDIAFALGALALVGSRLPLSLKVFLLTLATLDDLGAILIIALFYTADLSWMSLMLAAAALVCLIGLNRFGVSRAAPYLLIGIAMWLFVLQSGVHATLAGVAMALTIPLKRGDGTDFVHALEEGIHPYVKFLILPLFAFANAGIPFAGLSVADLAQPIPLGIAAGLALGKPIGIMLAVAACVAIGIAKLPESATWAQVFGVACLAGIGFTMSLFIGSLAFSAAQDANSVTLGILVGSLLSAFIGLAILFASSGRSAPI